MIKFYYSEAVSPKDTPLECGSADCTSWPDSKDNKVDKV